jgi:hypothetical protein
VNWASDDRPQTLGDGLGVRRIETDPVNGTPVEVLEVSPELAAHEGFEAALRTRAARLSGTSVEHLATVRRIERNGSVLRVIADHADGLRLPDFLHEAQCLGVAWSTEAAVALSAEIVRVVAALHRAEALSHGAVTPAHVVVSRRGVVTLTDAVFGPGLELLNRNREQLWREFRVALPPSATLPRFDRRGDVTALGATVLAVMLGRILRPDEYPRGIGDLVTEATREVRSGETGSTTSALRMWLQHALCLHPRSMLTTAVDAESAFDDVEGPPMTRQMAAVALRSRLRRIYGVTPASASAATIAAAWSRPGVVHSTATRPLSSEEATAGSAPPVPQEPSRRRLESLFRSVFHNFPTN